MSAHTGAVLPSTTLAAIEAYSPDLAERGLTEAQWEHWGPTLRARVSGCHVSAANARTMLSIVTGLLAWALGARLPLDDQPDVLWRETTQERYLKSLEASKSVAASTLVTYRRQLALVAAAMPVEQAPETDPLVSGWFDLEERSPVSLEGLGLADSPKFWDTLDRIGVELRKAHPDAHLAGTAVLGRGRALPYGTAEVSRLLRASGGIRVESTRVAVRSMLALGLGAGVDGADSTRVRGTDVASDDSSVTVTVRDQDGSVARTVKVLEPFAPLLLDLAQGAASTTLLRAAKSGKSRINRPSALADALATSDPHCVRLEGTRLRATWLCVHLAYGTPLRGLLRAAGVTTLVPIEPLMAYVPAAEAPTVRDMARPWGSP